MIFSEPDAPFQTLTRGMTVKGIDKSVDAALLWSQDSIVVSTYPKP